MALGLVLFGGLVFVLLLWMVGAGYTGGTINNGGSHVGGKGLNGYAALADYLDRRGWHVRKSQSESALKAPGLLVLTPPPEADGNALERIVNARRYIGPTLVISPKWRALPANMIRRDAKQGWVELVGTAPPEWKGFLDDVTVSIDAAAARGNAYWAGIRLKGQLPDASAIESGRGERLVPLVMSPDLRILAAYLRDDGYYRDLEDMALDRNFGSSEDEEVYPLIVVFEPDLLDNYGMAKPENARLADALFAAASERAGKQVSFDLTINGLSRSANLLTLAFTPPFLAATLCLIIAAIAVAWRAFQRFGPPIRAERAIAFGKRSLVANAAGLIRRTRRLHLIAAPYAEHARERIARALALPRMADADATEASIDRALAARRLDAVPFSVIAARLRAARGPHEILRAARELHTLERMLRT
jgi:hypothetical protein